MIGICKKCGNAYETTEGDANIPIWYAGPLTLDIQHDFRSTVGTAGVQKIAKELYDERIAYWVRGEQP